MLNNYVSAAYIAIIIKAFLSHTLYAGDRDTYKTKAQIKK